MIFSKHEYAFGSKPDADGNQFISLGLSESYHSHALNRGCIMKVAPDGKTTAFAGGFAYKKLNIVPRKLSFYR